VENAPDSAARDSDPSGPAPAAKARSGIQPAWWALSVIVLGVVGAWRLYATLEEDIHRHAGGAALPAGAIVAFALGSGKCPDNWREAAELRGRFLIGAGQGTGLENRPYGQPGGSEAFLLKPENLPPHRHQVSPSAGEMIGTREGTLGADGGDATPAHSVREGLTGEGIGLNGERLVAAPMKLTPPYLAYTFCRAEE
jgi:hypothetical protein